MLYTVTTLAEAHINRACELVHPGTDADGLVEAGRLLRTASGMFTFAAERIVPMLRHRSTGIAPMEATVPVLVAMSLVCLAQVRSQTCASFRLCPHPVTHSLTLSPRIHTHTPAPSLPAARPPWRRWHGQAQQCAIGKAELEGKGPGLLAKLEAGVCAKYGEAIRQLNTLVRAP